MDFFISDLHLGHKNVLSFDNRQFRNIETHDEEIVRRWNEAVGFDDDVYILGDIGWYGSSKMKEIFKNLNGEKHLIIGNHDKSLLKNSEFRKEFSEIRDYKELSLPDGKGIVLCHYPIPCFKNHYYGWYHLYGHVHNSFEANMMERVKYDMERLYDVPCKMFNVGCMMPYMDYTPRTLKEIEDSKII